MSTSKITPYEESTGFYSGATAMSSMVDTWSTPRKFFDSLSPEFNFTLDAAAMRSSALCPTWFGPDHEDPYMQDAFIRWWQNHASGGDIWLNPPYGKTIKDWMRKADQEAKEGPSRVVCLVPARTDTAWFQDYCLHHEVRFIRGRLKFGTAVNAAPFPSALVVMSNKESR